MPVDNSVGLRGGAVFRVQCTASGRGVAFDGVMLKKVCFLKKLQQQQHNNNRYNKIKKKKCEHDYLYYYHFTT